MENKQNIELWNLEIYKQIVDHMTESLWIWDKKNKTIYTNKIFCELTGYSLEEIIWENYNIFWDEESNELIKKLNDESTQTENKKYEANLKTKSGKIIPVLCSWSSTQNWWMVLTISDLRELKSLKEVEQNLIEINKTKDEFISIVWHELRTPLTSIRWYLSMILEWDMWETNPEVQKSLKHTYDSSVRLIKLVNDVLSMGKIESWRMEYYIKEYSVWNIVSSVYKDIHLEIENNNIEFIVDLEEDLKEKIIETDKDKLKQILLNLLSNAMKFTEKWWKITLRVSANWEKIKYEVIDTWEWIPKNKLKMLFNKFSQVESAMQRHNTTGLGLWLAISKNFIEAFWSKIHVESEVWIWSNFYFEL